MKSIFKSKTFWFNILAGAVQTLEVFVGTGLIPQPWGIVAQSVGNLVLRGITNEPVAVRTKLTKTAP